MTNDPLVSPQLIALQHRLDNGDETALEHFWRDVAQHGTPLIEPATDGECLATLLWRGDESTEGCVVVQDWGADGLPEHYMSLLPNTNVWYRTRSLPADTRTTYQLWPLPTPADAFPYRLDPLNPRTYTAFLAEEGDDIAFSLLELPAAPPQPWIDARVPRGTVTLHKPTNDGRRAWVYTPATTNAGSLPLLLFFDGRLYKDMLLIPQMLDYLIAAERIPPVLAVLLDNPERRELVCDAAFADYVAEQIIPWVHSSYPVRREPAATLVSGSSYGGLGALYCGLRHPDVFGMVLSQTGWFRWRPAGEREFEWLARQVVEQPIVPLHCYLDVGVLENARLDDDGPTHIVANRHMRDVLRAKGYPLHYVEYHGGHDYSSLAHPLAEALVLMLGR